MFKKVVANTTFQIIGKVVTAATTFLLTIIIGRSLGPTGYGEFTKIFVFVGYFYTIYDFGLNNIFVKVTSGKNLGKFLERDTSDEYAQNYLFRVLVGLRIVISLLLAIVAIVIAFALPYDSQLGTGFSPVVKAGIVLASITIVTQALTTSANALFQKKLRYDLSVLAAALGSIAVVAATVLVFTLRGGLSGYISAYIIGGTVSAAAAFVIIAKKLKVPPLPIFNRRQAKKLIGSSWPIGLALILNLVYFRIDVLILSHNRASPEVGFYGLSYQFFDAFLTVPLFISNALYPLLAKLHASDKKKFVKEAKFYFALMIVASLVLAAALYLVSLLIPAFYGTKFAPAKASLQILALGLPFFFASALLWHISIIREKQKLLPVIYGLGAAFNLVVNLILIPIYGYIGAASTTVASELLVVLLLILALKKEPKSAFDDNPAQNVQ